MEQLKELNVDIVHYLQRTIRKLTFHHAIKPPLLYDIVAECKFEDLVFDDLYYDRNEVNDSIGDRIKRIIKLRFLPNNGKDKNNHRDLFREPKIYDDKMQDVQIDLYNSVISLLDLPSITTIYSDDFLLKIHEIDNSKEMDDNALAIIAPYAFAEERSGMNFPELIFLSAFLLSNERMEKPKHYGEEGFDQYALRQLKNLKEAFASKNLYESLIMTFTDFLAEEIVAKYDEIRIPYIREYLVPDKYKKRKDMDAALVTHLKKVHECQEKYMPIANNNDFEHLSRSEKLEVIRDLEIALPVAELILLGNEIKKISKYEYIFTSNNRGTIFQNSNFSISDIPIDARIYNISTKISQIIKSYIDNAIFYAKEILFSLEEAKIVTTDTINEFLETI